MDTLTSVVTRLKKIKPTKLRVHCVDGEVSAVKMPTSRKRWEEITRILGRLDWLKLEACNARGEVLDVLENDDAPEDDDDLLEGGDIDTRVVGLVTRLVKIALDAADKSVDRTTAHMKELLESTIKVNRSLAEQQVSTMRMYDAKLKIIDGLVDTEAEGGLMSTEFMQNLPAMLQAAQALKGGGGNNAT